MSCEFAGIKSKYPLLFPIAVSFDILILQSILNISAPRNAVHGKVVPIPLGAAQMKVESKGKRKERGGIDEERNMRE